MDDKALQQAITDELDFDPSVNAAHIGVAVEHGVVTLTGHVSSYAEKLAAEEAVRQVRGVHAIAQEIEVRFPEHKKTADDQIAERALRVIAWHVSIPRDAVQVTVQNGWVTLTGEVQWHYQRAAAEEAVRKLTGVAGVLNRIELRAAPAVEAHEIRRRIEQALKRRAEAEAAGIRVTVKGHDTVTLEGKVHAYGERWLAQRTAWSVPGVKVVEDRLTVA